MSRKAAKLKDVATQLKPLSADGASSDEISTRSQTTISVGSHISRQRGDVDFAEATDLGESLQHGESTTRLDAHVRTDYLVMVTKDRKFDEVSDSFCKLLGYRRDELVGKKYDDFTAPMTNDIPVVLELFIKSGYMHGIWVLVHRRGTKILVRYESWVRPDGRFESHMELIGAGA
jgi:PAS domain S-box-containing protein